LDARLGLPEDRCSYVLRDWNQALVVEAPYAQVKAVLERILGLKPSVASLEAMPRPSPPTTTPGDRSPTARKWRCSARRT
jgi:hypothetical protein